MNLFQKRDFNRTVTDTFEFAKGEFRNFYGNFFVVGGVYLLLISVFYVVYLRIFPQLVKSETAQMAEYIPVFVVLGVVFFLAMVASVYAFAYTPAYLVLYSQGNEKPTSKQIFNLINHKIWPLIKFGIACVLLYVPLVFAFFLGMLLLMITVVGILALPVLFAFVCLFYMLALYERFYNPQARTFACFSAAFRLIKVNFWQYGFAITIVLLAVGTFSSIFYGMALVGSISQVMTGAESASLGIGIFTMVLGTVSTISMVLFSTLIFICGGVIYFSAKDQNENIGTRSAIDSIGE